MTLHQLWWLISGWTEWVSEMATDTDCATVDEIQQLELVERANEPNIKLHVFLIRYIFLIMYTFFQMFFNSFSASAVRRYHF